MAAYYMTHKRGATYNWKRVEQFFTLFFQIGDCGFDSDGHHGTPLQRMAAAQLGYETANQTQKQGHIMSPQELHEIFVASLSNLLQRLKSRLTRKKQFHRVWSCFLFLHLPVLRAHAAAATLACSHATRVWKVLPMPST